MYWKVEHIVAIMEQLFPRQLAEKWDNPGLQIGSLRTEISKVVVALDLDETVVEYAISQKAALVITHHPFIFRPLHSIDTDRPAGRIIAALVKNDISVYCAHTNLDAAPGGLNDWLAEVLGLSEIRNLPGNSNQRLFKLVVYVPEEHEGRVREALAGAGAGHIGKYSDCSFRVAGTGTFRPGEGSRPFIGNMGRLEEVGEYRLETVVASQDLNGALSALKASHPYEEPAFDIIALENPVERGGIGRSGLLPAPVSLSEFCSQVQAALKINMVRAAGNMDKLVSKVAVVGGAGASFVPGAIAAGADVLVTGDVKYHEALEARDAGIAVVDAGHYGTEIIMAARLAGELNQLGRQQGIDTVFVPFENRNCFTDVY